MKDDPPTELGEEFWTALVLIALLATGTFGSIWFENYYGASILGLWLCLNLYRLIYHIGRVRLARALEKDPELKRIHDAPNQ